MELDGKYQGNPHLLFFLALVLVCLMIPAVVVVVTAAAVAGEMRSRHG